jgi:hypothetical protein
MSKDKPFDLENYVDDGTRERARNMSAVPEDVTIEECQAKVSELIRRGATVEALLLELGGGERRQVYGPLKLRDIFTPEVVKVEKKRR